MVKLCHTRVNQIREEIELRIEESNMRYFGNNIMLHKIKPISILINEMIRMINTILEE